MAWGMHVASCVAVGRWKPPQHLLIPVRAGNMCISDGTGSCTGPVIPCPVRMQQCTVDICFAIDGSGSIEEANAWSAEVSIVRGIVGSIGGANSNLAVWMFSDAAQQIVAPTTVGQAKATESFTRALPNFQPPYGRTQAAGALQACLVCDADLLAQLLLTRILRTRNCLAPKLLQDVFDGLPKTVGTRDKTIVLITDGQLGDATQCDRVVKTAKSRGVSIVTVGVGAINADQLRSFASNPSFFIRAPDFSPMKLWIPTDAAAKTTCRVPPGKYSEI